MSRHAMGYRNFANKNFANRTFAIGERPPDIRQYTLCTFANWRKSTKLSPIHANTFANSDVTLDIIKDICIFYIYTVLRQLVKVY